MAFQRETDVTKDRIAAIEIRVYAKDPLNPDDTNAGYLDYQIGYSDGTTENRSRNDLLSRLQDDAAGQQHLQNLINLRDYIRGRLEAEVLPL